MNSRHTYRVKIAYGANPQPVTAVALGYDPERDPAPRVLASGRGMLAERIIAIAREEGIPLREDPALAAALAMVDVEAMIPPELYALVAEVLAYLYRLQARE